MLGILFGILLGIGICLFIPPKELAIKLIIIVLKLCDAITKTGKEQLEKIEKIEKENESR